MLTRDEAFKLAQQQSPTLEEVLIKIEHQARAGEYMVKVQLLSQNRIDELEKLGYSVYGNGFSSSVISWR